MTPDSQGLAGMGEGPLANTGSCIRQACPCVVAWGPVVSHVLCCRYKGHSTEWEPLKGRAEAISESGPRPPCP